MGNGYGANEDDNNGRGNRCKKKGSNLKVGVGGCQGKSSITFDEDGESTKMNWNLFRRQVEKNYGGVP